MWNKVIKIFLYIGINILFFLKLFLLSTFLTSPLFNIIAIVLNGRCETWLCILIWFALSTVLTIAFSIRVLWKVHEMKSK